MKPRAFGALHESPRWSAGEIYTWTNLERDQTHKIRDKTRGGFLEAIDLLKSIEILLRESEEIFYSAGGKQLFRQRAKDAQRLQRQLASQLRVSKALRMVRPQGDSEIIDGTGFFFRAIVEVGVRQETVC